MTISADWRVFVILRSQHAVGALIVQVNNLGMTDRTVDFARILAFRILLVIHVHMALGAGYSFFLVDRMFEILDIDIEAPLFTVGQYHLQVGIGMTFQAELVIEAVFVKDPSCLVRAVAFNTGGDLVRLLFPQLASDDLGVGLFNIRMAFHAGLNHIQTADC